MRRSLSLPYVCGALWAVAPLVLVLMCGRADANPSLRKELTEVAKNIKQLLDGRSETSIAVGQFSGPANFPTSSGPGIAQTLSEELKAAGVTVKQRAKLGIKGEYHPIEVADDLPGGTPGAKVMAVQLKGTVEDGFGKVLTDFSFKLNVKGETAFVEMLGVPVNLPTTVKTPVQRAKVLKDAYVNPLPPPPGPRVSAGKRSPFAMEVLVDGKVRPAHNEDGLPFVKIARGETYQVRLINDSPNEVAVRLCIDGLNSFTFSELRQPDNTPEGKPNPRKGESLMSAVVIGPKSDTIVKGWHRNNTHSDEFLVTEYAKGAAANLPASKGQVGTITATFSAAWPQDSDPPKDEPEGARDVYSGNATAIGARIEASFAHTPRKIGAVRASLSVRYSK